VHSEETSVSGGVTAVCVVFPVWRRYITKWSVVRTTKKRTADDIIKSKSSFVLSPEIEDRLTDRQLGEQNARIV
jgi:hypothetical protein